tara:strand:+ start:1097 stop:1798 length:702 start_codon:yes stop_codon:yes gene_type:complete
MPKSNKYWVVIPAAGIGKRMGSDIPKQYVSVRGKTVIEHTIDNFISRKEIQNICISISESDNYWSTLPISKNKKIITTVGGNERYESVYNGLRALQDKANDDDWVLVHDAVRPCLKKSIIDRLITDISSHDVGGILALPCFETMKRVNNSNEVEETINRETIWRAQTPQVFKYQKLLLAIEKVINENIFITDEAMAMELSNHKPIVILGDENNIKITHKTDLKYLELFLEKTL